MADYSFLNLSWIEFEELSRDLLQRKLSVFIESFTTGKDAKEEIDVREEESAEANYESWMDTRISIDDSPQNDQYIQDMFESLHESSDND